MTRREKRMNLKRLSCLALCVALLLTMAAAAHATPLGGDYYEWLYYFSGGVCSSPDAKRDNSGQHGWELVEHIDPTCTEKGYGLYQCIYCDSQTEMYPSPLGHNWYWWAEDNKQETCGATIHYHSYCTRCGIEGEEQIVTIEHIWSEWTYFEDPTCDKEGVGARTCERCGTVETQHTPALGHDWDEGVILKQPDCTNTGEALFTCKRDSSHTKTEAIPVDPDAHDWDEGKLITSNCEAGGVIQYTCKNDSNHIKQVPAAAQSHSWVIVSQTDATCGLNGEINYKCSVCGQTKTETLPATQNHSFGEWQTSQEPTCVTVGKQYRVCAVCGALEWRDYPVNGPSGHDWGLWTTIKEATCEGQGVYVRKCTLCGQEEYENTFALGHDWDDGKIVKKPGVFTSGKKLYTCKRDPSHQMTEDIPPLGEGLSPEEILELLHEQELHIVTEPVSGYVDHDGKTPYTLSVTAGGGTTPYTYQWQYNNPLLTLIGLIFGLDVPEFSDIDGATESSYGATLWGYYRCIVYDDEGNSVTSEPALVKTSLYVSTQPKNGYMYAGGECKLSADAAGGEELSAGGYTIKWYKVGNEKPIKTANSRKDNTLPVKEAGSYYCVFTDANGETATSDTVKVQIAAELGVNMSKTGSGTSQVAVATIVGGVPPYDVHWWCWTEMHGGYTYDETREDQTEKTQKLSFHGYGTYEVEIVDAEGHIARNQVTLPGPAFSFSRQPGDKTLNHDGYTTLVAKVANGKAPYSVDVFLNGEFYSWSYFDDENITFDVYDEGNYVLEVTDSNFYTKTSRTAKVSPYTSLKVTRDQSSATLHYRGDTVNISVTASKGTPGYTYQWYKWQSNEADGAETSAYFKSGKYVPISGATSRTLPVTDTKPGKYFCSVKDKAGDKVNSMAIEVYYDAPQITLSPSYIHASSIHETNYFYCHAIPSKGYDQTTLYYQWQVLTEKGWENVGRPQQGQNTAGWKSSLKVTGNMYGQWYQCLVIEVGGGSIASGSVNAYADLKIDSFIQVGKDPTLRIVASGGIQFSSGQPYKVEVSGYAIVPTTYTKWCGIVTETYKGYWDWVYPTNSYYAMPGDGSAIFVFNNVPRYRWYIGDTNIYVFVVILGDVIDTPYHYSVTVTDARGDKTYSNYIEMKW